ncbi:flavin-containing monooxygenase [Thermomonospora umbrina]|uniref:Cation diffusion facilitator CzcD-associated flavoprotein CzcO n=1 Tax=Thermomonospora umbrina TaxID=111806 RepID=A0A3D9STT5_9ACTN|nr:NAD(P)/FAD-dependent oxidoreductase [Thermomonospora umbrina]REE99379.1 cation diffusion facilitator CzcD-associated flavoprotein CzcO [Thermomonospora umbrina]
MTPPPQTDTGAEEVRGSERIRPDTEVAIIGAGLSGLGMGIALRRAGIEDFVILERADDIGGTWRDNTYPGVGVDVPAQAYQFSFELNPGWSRVFAPGAEVKAYLDGLADRYGLRRRVRLGSEVVERVWDQDARLWRLRLAGAGEVVARFVVSAIGPFVDPKPIDIAGADRFAGAVLRSSRWDDGCDLTGKRVAVIGTGASAVQLVPEIAAEASRLDVYQRTPIWVAPKPDVAIPRVLMGLFRRSPRLQEVVRRLTTRAVELLLIDVVVHHRRAPWLARTGARLLRSLWYRWQVRDPEVRRRLTPDYGLGCKRPSVSNTYLRAFNLPHVSLITDSIARITENGVQTLDGHERQVDAIVLATGFRLASDPENYRRTPVRGRDGFDLATTYTQNRLASYEGISIPGLPNHFMMFGPYGWVGGTWHQLVETTSAHIVRVITEAHRRGAAVVEIRTEPTERWTEQMRERLAGSLWATGDCGTANSYYFDHHGDTPYLRPTSSAQARRASRTFPLDDYDYLPATPHAPAHLGAETAERTP